MADEERQDPKWSEVLKRVFAAGVSGAMLSEEAIRSYLQDVKLPKDVLGLIVAGAAKSKEEVAGRVTKEIIGLLRKVDIVQEISRFAEDHKFKITAEIEITRKDRGGPSLIVKTEKKVRTEDSDEG
jgi:hypothetical protein